jgi:hypothetical protein
MRIKTTLLAACAAALLAPAASQAATLGMKGDTTKSVSSSLTLRR